MATTKANELGQIIDFIVPSSLGTAGQVLTVNSGATAATFADAGGGADLYAAESVGATDPTASGTKSIAIGHSVTSTGQNSVSIGALSDATGNSSLAIGGQTQATAAGATAIGWPAQASGAYSTSIGVNSGTNKSISAGVASFAAMGSYASGTDSFAASIANNTTSYGASGSNSVAMGSQAKATGISAVALSKSASATGHYSVAIGWTTGVSGTESAALAGRGASASGIRSLALGNFAKASAQDTIAISNEGSGYYTEASAIKAIAIGTRALSNIKGKLAVSNGAFSANGDSQTGTFVMRSDTTDATAEAMTTNNSTASTDNQVILPNNSCFGFTGTVIARENSAQTNDFAVWEIKGGAVRAANASTTALGTYNINKISESTGATNWSIALSADTTNGAVAITVTGEASHSIRWVATVNTTEVIY